MVVGDAPAMAGLLDMRLGLLLQQKQDDDEAYQGHHEEQDEGVAELVEDGHAREDQRLKRARLQRGR